MSSADKNCTFLISTEKSSGVHQDDVCKKLENEDPNVKVEALKSAITGMLAGESMPKVLMTVIRYVYLRRSIYRYTTFLMFKNISTNCDSSDSLFVLSLTFFQRD
jgi:hypothetical protein